jgi:hypothetical protein
MARPAPLDAGLPKQRFHLSRFASPLVRNVTIAFDAADDPTVLVADLQPPAGAGIVDVSDHAPAHPFRATSYEAPTAEATPRQETRSGPARPCRGRAKRPAKSPRSVLDPPDIRGDMPHRSNSNVISVTSNETIHHEIWI